MDSQTGLELWSVDGKSGSISAISISPNGKHVGYILLKKEKYNLILADARSGVRHGLAVELPCGSLQLAWAEDSKMIAAVLSNGKIVLIETCTGLRRDEGQFYVPDIIGGTFLRNSLTFWAIDKYTINHDLKLVANVASSEERLAQNPSAIWDALGAHDGPLSWKAMHLIRVMPKSEQDRYYEQSLRETTVGSITRNEVLALVKELGSSAFRVRERAHGKLLADYARIKPYLENLENELTDPEIARRLEQIRRAGKDKAFCSYMRRLRLEELLSR
jgi:hypothetical protein